jgi:hypothetical protein
MKRLLGLLLCVGALSGCEADYVPVQSPPAITTSDYLTGTFEFCDGLGYCRTVVSAPYFFDANGVIMYWDAHFGCWIGPHSYWMNGYYHLGYHPAYHQFYGGSLHYRGGGLHTWSRGGGYRSHR